MFFIRLRLVLVLLSRISDKRHVGVIISRYNDHGRCLQDARPQSAAKVISATHRQVGLQLTRSNFLLLCKKQRLDSDRQEALEPTELLGKYEKNLHVPALNCTLA